MMKKRILHLIFPFTALIFELLPYGAVLNFANPEGDPFRTTFSYFDLTPFGYANFAPLITALLTCILLFLAVVYIGVGGHRLRTALITVSVLACAASVMPIFVGAYSLVGALITASLIMSAVLAALVRNDK